MSTKIALEPAVARRQPLLTSKSGEGSCRRSRMGETTGDCAAVCCCCPFAMVHLLILAVYRLPRGLWRKKKRRRLLRKKRKISSEEKANRKPNAEALYGGDESTEEEEEEDIGDKNDVDWEKRCGTGSMEQGFGGATRNETTIELEKQTGWTKSELTKPVD